MELETFLEKLQKARYFEGYSEEANVKATKAIRKRHAAGLASEQKAYFERFPGLSLVVTEIDQEMMGRDDLKLVLKQLGGASSGMFAPQSIRIQRKATEDRYRLEFTVDGTRHAFALEDESWIPGAFFFELNKVTSKHCGGLLFHGVDYPDPGQSGFYLWCTPRAYKAVARAGLIPSLNQPLEGKPETTAPTKTKAQGKAATPTAEEPNEFPPPADPVRAERMGLFRKGKWRFPNLSAKMLAAWKQLASAKDTSAAGKDLDEQINQTFDLLCARHCGLIGVGSAMDDAKRVVALVNRYLFGAWRVGYVKDGVKLTEATARKELMWSTQVEMGCAAAVSVGDELSLRRFIEYPCGDVYDENFEQELAFYRLLSDVVLQRNDWDWQEQAGIIAAGYIDRYPKLLRCLEGLRTDDKELFQKAFFKFGGKPKFTPPHLFRGVVECDVTILAALARQKGWPSKDYPVHLQDRILDRTLFA